MKKIILFVMTLVVLVFGFSSAKAQFKIPKVNPKSVKMVKPDLKISSVEVSKTSDNFIEKISVTVSNGCQATAPDSYLLISFRESADKQPFFYVGNTTLALKGGASYTQTFDVKDKKIAASSYIFIEADSNKKVSEGDESNNWRQLNPNSSPFPSMGVCDPK